MNDFPLLLSYSFPLFFFLFLCPLPFLPLGFCECKLTLSPILKFSNFRPFSRSNNIIYYNIASSLSINSLSFFFSIISLAFFSSFFFFPLPFQSPFLKPLIYPLYSLFSLSIIPPLPLFSLSIPYTSFYPLLAF